MTRVLVTGANGHVGANTVRSLLQRGYEVVPFVRTTSDQRGIKQLGLACKYGDVMDYPSLEKAADGCDAIIHHAAVFQMWTNKPEVILQTAVEGTRNIFKAAKAARVRRMVYTSSMVAVGYSTKPNKLRTEADWNNEAKSPYFIAKTQAEREAQRLSEEYDIPTIRLCPAMIFGPLDYGVTPSTNLLLRMINKDSSTFVGGTNFVHVKDVAETHALALEKGEPGSRYIVGGDNIKIKDLAPVIKRCTGVTPDHFPLTGPIAQLLMAMLNFSDLQKGKIPFIDSKTVPEQFGRFGYYDCSHTKETFGITPKGIEDVIRDAIRWLLFIGKINPEVAELISPNFPPETDWVK